MKRIKVLIIEDELIIAEKIKLILEDIGYNVVGAAASFDQGISLFSKHHPDVVIADINLDGEKDGVDLICVLRESSDFKAIFVTSYSDQKTIEKAKVARPDAYLVKPFGKEDLYATIEIATQKEPYNENDAKSKTPHLYVKIKNAIVKVELDKIVAVKSEDIYCTFIMDDGQKHMVRSSMKQLLEKLGGEFLRIHKSYLIQFNMIDKMEYDYVLIGQNKFPIGRTYRNELMERLSPL
jgi:two-component system response regulator LytT